MREVLGEKDVPECRWVGVVGATGRTYMEMRWQVPVAVMAAVPVPRTALPQELVGQAA